MTPCSHQFLRGRLLRALAFCGVLLQPSLSAVSQAQTATAVTSDGTLGTQVTQNGSIRDITGGNRPGEGPNLFHSFGQFSVGASGTANFSNNTGAPTTNILGRVTGGQVSNILGTIRTTGFPGANLFLMNPAGMVFGPNASLNVNGAVHFTTADFLRLADGVPFNAVSGPSDALLSSAPVEAFGFLNDNPAGINVNGSSLKVPEGETLSLVGGDITVAGNPDQPPDDEAIPSLAAEGGRVNLVSVAPAGEVPLTATDNTTDFRLDSFERLGEITLSKAASVDTSGDFGGTVVIRGGRLTIEDDSSIFSNTTGPGEGPSGNIIISANSMKMVRGGFIGADTTDMGDGPNINVQVKKGLEMQNSRIRTRSFLGGKAGDVVIQADSIKMIGTAEAAPVPGIASQAGPESLSKASAGNISISANSLEMDKTFISTTTFGAGQAGNTDVNVERGDVLITGSNEPNAPFFGIFTNTVTLPSFPVSTGVGGGLRLVAHNLKLTNQASLQAATDGTGDAGNVTVTLTGNLEVQEGSFIQTVAADNTTGDAGDLSITAQDIAVTGISDATDFEESPEFTGISTSAFSGQGGTLFIEANNLTVRDKAFVNTATRGSGNSGDLSINLSGNLLVENGGLIFADAREGSSGNAGALSIQADSIVLSGANPTLSRRLDGSDLVPTRSTITSQSRGQGGNGGDIQLTARRLSVLDGASITAESTSTGDAGNIDITASDSILIDNSSVTTEAKQADGGNITLMAPNIIRLVDDSQLTTSVGGDSQTEGGNIDIDPRFVILDNDSKILAQAGEGTGGRIDISTDILFASLNNIDASSDDGGIDGTVDIDSPATDIISGTLELPESFLNVQSLLSTRCASRTTKPASSFFVTNGGLPLGPDTLIPAGVTGVGIDSAESDGPQSDLGDEIPELLVRTSAFGGCAGAM